MSEWRKLRDISIYSEDRISSSKTTLNDYVSIDSMLPNKNGIITATKLPPTNCSLIAYKKGDILIGNIRPYLKKIWYADKCGGCSADVLCIDTKNIYSSKFVYYALSEDKFFEYTMKGVKGSKMPRGDKAQIMDYCIPLLPLITQQRIATVLSSLDNKIALNNRIISELEAMAKELYDYWFVQFDFPDTTGKPYRSSGGKMVYNEKLKREIPEGWEVKLLSSYLTIISGFPFKSEDYKSNGEYKIITIKNVQDGFLDTTSVNYLDFIPEGCQSEILQLGDVLISLTGNVGRICVVNQQNLLLNQRVGKFISEPTMLTYFLYLFKSGDKFQRIQNLACGCAQQNLSPIEVVNDFFVLPKSNILGSFYDKLSPLLSLSINCSQSNQELTTLRDWLLPMLMNGQVRVE